ncbi:hypothetical protein HZH68_014300 [Vespula germanica]|uniref:Uncharacterized protein n=1 Tax=Vespula germanica TaxID=30212 RepID=A0A834J9Z0_VESGE|nr:hypothetical protein HZH68_014300 [Vespula germanica]
MESIDSLDNVNSKVRDFLSRITVEPSPSPSIQPLDAWKKGWKTLWSKLGVGWEFVGGEYERIARLGHNTKGAMAREDGGEVRELRGGWWIVGGGSSGSDSSSGGGGSGSGSEGRGSTSGRSKSRYSGELDHVRNG